MIGRSLVRNIGCGSMALSGRYSGDKSVVTEVTRARAARSG